MLELQMETTRHPNQCQTWEEASGNLDNDLNLKNKGKQANKKENNKINQEMHKERNPTKKMQTKRNKE